MNDAKKILYLEFIVKQTLWMAVRYAHNRSTYVTKQVNECVDIAIGLGIKMERDETIGDIYAADGMFGKWKNGRFEK